MAEVPEDVKALVDRLRSWSRQVETEAMGARGHSWHDEAEELEADAACLLAAADALDGFLAERAAVRALPRADELLRAIHQLMPARTWSVKEMGDLLASSGSKATRKELYNAIGYLNRKGFIVNQGYGRYINARLCEARNG